MMTLPNINLNHLQDMTDDTGILQHSFYSIPRWEHGYCVDDNARALIAMCMYYRLRKDQQAIGAIKKYLYFLYNAFNQETGRFHNFMSYGRRWLEKIGSEDAHSRAILALGTAMNMNLEPPIHEQLGKLFLNSVRSTEKFKHPRPWAFTLIGIDYYLRVYHEDTIAKKSRAILAQRLYNRFQEHASEDWPWLDNMLTYANAQVSRALLLTGQGISNKDMLRIGLESLRWLLHQQMNEEGWLSLIGSNGWMQRNGKRAQFAQQPIEVMGLIRACAEAYDITQDTTWLQEAQRCFEWFLGKNDLNLPVYDAATGGCHDSLESHGVNENMGAESTLSWLISLLTMYELSEYMMEC